MHVSRVNGHRDTGTGRPTYRFNNWRGHGQQVAGVARDIAHELGLSEGAAARVERAARCHDIGKSKLPDLFDDPEYQYESLSRPERELLMSHTWLGYRMLQDAPNPDSWVADAALLHHERWNGTGYPLGLTQSDIPLVARIVAVADAFSTLLDEPHHYTARQIENALARIKAESGTWFDPGCVTALSSLIDRQAPLLSHGTIAAGPESVSGTN